MITLFSTDCPKCKVLEKKLEGRAFTISHDLDEVINAGFMEAPILKIDTYDEPVYLTFGEAVKWIKEN